VKICFTFERKEAKLVNREKWLKESDLELALLAAQTFSMGM
jgi:hypothetical protein